MDIGVRRLYKKGGKCGKVGNFYQSYFCLMTVSKKQKPVVDQLVLILSKAKDVAAAIADNAIDDTDPLSIAHLRAFSSDLNEIKSYLQTASDIPKP